MADRTNQTQQHDIKWDKTRKKLRNERSQKPNNTRTIAFEQSLIKFTQDGAGRDGIGARI